MEIEKRIELIKRNTKEIITLGDLHKLLEEKAHPRAYFGTAPTGPFHIGYLIPMSKIFDFEKAGINTIILLADIHAALDDLKTKWEELDKKAEYYQMCIEHAFPWKTKPSFVRGSSFQLEKKYVQDMLKLSTITTIKRAMRAASEVTRMKNPKVSELIYPIMQALDEQYLDVDIQLGGIDQRHILAYAREVLPLLGYKKRVEVTVPLIASIKGPGTKMSASLPETCIKIYDSEEGIRKKIMKAYCPSGVVEENPILQLYRYLVFPIYGDVVIERPRKYGGDVAFSNYQELEKAFISQQIHPLDLKQTLSSYIIKTFSDARKAFDKKLDLLQELGPAYLPG
jgi:tyrosyl-tRNA synthetase